MRVKVYFQMSINLYNAEIEEEKHLITLGHHTIGPVSDLLDAYNLVDYSGISGG